MPDMAQMPKIASLFAVSLDDLFGYEPQLSSAEATAWYVEVLAQFADDPATAFRRCGEMAVRYWSCVEVLFYMGRFRRRRAVPTVPCRATRRLMPRWRPVVSGA